jgi:hypothetical protein
VIEEKRAVHYRVGIAVTVEVIASNPCDEDQRDNWNRQLYQAMTGRG